MSRINKCTLVTIKIYLYIYIKYPLSKITIIIVIGKLYFWKMQGHGIAPILQAISEVSECKGWKPCSTIQVKNVCWWQGFNITCILIIIIIHEIPSTTKSPEIIRSIVSCWTAFSFRVSFIQNFSRTLFYL